MRAHGRVYQAGTQQRSEYEGQVPPGRRIGPRRPDRPAATGPRLPDGRRPDPAPVHRPRRRRPARRELGGLRECLPWFNYDGSTGAHRFAFGDINWGQHHYDIVQWGVVADDTGPVEIRLENGKPVFRYANGVEVYGCPPPGAGLGTGRGLLRGHAKARSPSTATSSSPIRPR